MKSLVPAAVVLAALTGLALPACRASSSPANGPEATCTDACRARASSCGDDQCARGCRFVMDRLVEREGPRVMACVARTAKSRACDDTVFADCAAQTGIHADGGPPAPPPPTEVDLAGEDEAAKKKDDGDDL